MHNEIGQKVETAVEARAGFLDRPVLVVLAVSVALVVGCFGMVFFGFFGTS
jgi:hypothetical protein